MYLQKIRIIFEYLYILEYNVITKLVAPWVDEADKPINSIVYI